jgi:hypothetical protein
MINLKLLSLIFLVLWSQSCSSLAPSSRNANANINREVVNPNTDYKKLVIGKWKGVHSVDDELVMYITFNQDGTVIEDYSPVKDYTGKKKVVKTYKFKNEKTIILEGLPNNMVIYKKSDDEIWFYPETKVEGDMFEIFTLSFKRIKE